MCSGSNLPVPAIYISVQNAATYRSRVSGFFSSGGDWEGELGGSLVLWWQTCELCSAAVSHSVSFPLSETIKICVI